MSSHIRPDPARRIDLPGVGPVARPLEVGHDVSGLSDLSMRTYDFAAGNVIDGEAEGDEVVILALSGQVSLAVTDHASGAESAWGPLGSAAEGPRPPGGIYLPPRHSYRLTVHERATVAYARSAAVGNRPAARLTWTAANDASALELEPGVTERLGCRDYQLPVGARVGIEVERESILYVAVASVAAVTAVTSDAEHVLMDGHALALEGGAAVQLTAPADSQARLVLFSATPAV